MFILILIIAVIVLYWLVKGGLSVLGGAVEGAQNLIDPQTTDESAAPLIARSAGKAAKIVYPAGDIHVIEFLPKEKSMPVEVTSTEDIERIKRVKDKTSGKL